MVTRRASQSHLAGSLLYLKMPQEDGSMNDNRVQFRNANVARALAERCDVSRRSLTAARDLERYYALLADELEGLQGTAPNALTEKEMPIIVEALADTTFTVGTIPLLWAIVVKNLPEHDRLHAAGIDADILIRKLRELTPGQAYALVDAIERARRKLPAENREIASKNY